LIPPPFASRAGPPVFTKNEPNLIHLGGPESEPERHEHDIQHDIKDGLAHQVKTGNSTSATSLASSGSASASASQFKLPPLAPPMDLFREFWPRVVQELSHLMQESSSPPDVNADNMGQCIVNQAPTNTIVDSPVQAGVIESPLTGEALLKRPDVSSVQPEMLQSNLAHFNRSLAALLNTSSPAPPSPLAPAITDDNHQADIPQAAPQVSQQDPEAPLSAVFLGDNVSDNQVFPPGAEFVKFWRMLNNGTRAWPETTLLQLEVGESFARDRQTIKVGSVAPGAVIDLWTGELKAPESSGKYISYWRLNDGQGNMFGHSVWIDITVADQERSTDRSLASSSIIMPQSAPAKSAASSDIVTAMIVSPAIASLPRTDDATSDNESDGSSVSLISIPSSDDDDDDPSIWEDSRSHAALLPPPDRARAAMEYVVLYDDSSSDEA